MSLITLSSPSFHIPYITLSWRGPDCFLFMTPSIMPDSVQACWETKFFVLVLLVALSTIPLPHARNSLLLVCQNPHMRLWP